MKRVLAADWFELRKLKSTILFPVIAVAMGLFLPLMYYGTVIAMRQISDLPGMDPHSLASMKMLMDSFDAKTVFYSCLPLSQGFGMIIVAMIGFRAVRPFGTGMYRNKVITQIPRSAIYASQSLICLLITLICAALFTATSALTTRLTFGPLELTTHAVWVVVLLSLGIYLVYTAIPVFVAFLTRSVPLTIIIAILLPVLAQTTFTLAASALSSVSETVADLLTILPAVQTTDLSKAALPDKLIVIALASDTAISALLTLFGILRFKRMDLK